MDFDDLVTFVETKLAAMDPVCRVRLVKKLQTEEKRKGADRVTARAKMFMEQRGKCAACGETIRATGPALWKYQTEGQPIRCRVCVSSG
jgi:hypothetical protein